MDNVYDFGIGFMKVHQQVKNYHDQKVPNMRER
jgi:hypothetical protein